MYALTDDRDKSELLESWSIGNPGRTDTEFWNADLFLVQVHSLLMQSMVVPIGAFPLKLIWSRPHGSARMDFHRNGGPQKHLGGRKPAITTGADGTRPMVSRRNQPRQ
jgi:hypothetical protein